MKDTFYSNGKLLISGEYLVLDGATALAIPTLYGQSLDVVRCERKGIHWQSIDNNETIWFKGIFQIEGDQISCIKKDDVTIRLLNILQKAKNMNPKFLQDSPGWNITTRMGFPRDWGLGSSSTLINNIAQWAEVDALSLLETSFGGSGYDIAAAQSDGPILYVLEMGDAIIDRVELLWDFIDQLFFVHLNRKQDSREGIAHYRKTAVSVEQLSAISAISLSLPGCIQLSEFEKLLVKHEEIISGILKIPTIKEQLFSDYPHIIKSLGSWGGDFILVRGDDSDYNYFRNKGYQTIIPFRDMIL